MIRIDAIWMATAPLDMRAGTDTALARVVKVFGGARPHHAYLFANARANRMKVLIHDGSPSSSSRRQQFDFSYDSPGAQSGQLRRPARPPAATGHRQLSSITPHHAGAAGSRRCMFDHPPTAVPAIRQESWVRYCKWSCKNHIPASISQTSGTTGHSPKRWQVCVSRTLQKRRE